MNYTAPYKNSDQLRGAFFGQCENFANLGWQLVGRMCCYDRVREQWVMGLVLVATLFSLGVAVPMILVSYPGNECLLFVRWAVDNKHFTSFEAQYSEEANILVMASCSLC